VANGALTPTELSLRGRLAVETSWANTSDRSARTKPGRDKFDERFLNEVDPERRLPEDERERRAAHARRAYFARLSLAAHKARRRKRNARSGGPTDKSAAVNNDPEGAKYDVERA